MPQAAINGITLNYEVAGNGAPLLLIMGLGGTLDGWRKELPFLTDHFQVIYFDNRGVGQTTAPTDFTAYSMEHFAADAIGLLDHLGIERAHVWGVSMGGMIAQHVALNYPERVQGLVLGCTLSHSANDPSAIPTLPAEFQAEASNLAPEAWVLELMLSGTQKSAEQVMHDSVRFNFAPAFVAAHPDVIEEYIEVGMRNHGPAHGFMGQWSAIMNHSTIERLPKLQHPTLVQHGDADALVPIGNGRLLAYLLPNAEFQLIPGSGHCYFIEQPELASQGVTAFLQSL